MICRPSFNPQALAEGGMTINEAEDSEKRFVVTRTKKVVGKKN